MIVLFNFFQRAIKESQECAYIFQSNYFKFLITYFNQIILNNQSFFLSQIMTVRQSLLGVIHANKWKKSSIILSQKMLLQI